MLYIKNVVIAIFIMVRMKGTVFLNIYDHTKYLFIGMCCETQYW